MNSFSLKEPMFILYVMENGLFLEMLLAAFLNFAFICLCNTCWVFFFYIFVMFNIPPSASHFSSCFTTEIFWQVQLIQSLKLSPLSWNSPEIKLVWASSNYFLSSKPNKGDYSHGIWGCWFCVEELPALITKRFFHYYSYSYVYAWRTIR